MDTNIRISGEAGQGIQTIGSLLAATFAEMGLHVFCTNSYMSRIRGGDNSFDIRISGEELFSGREKADLLVALNERSFHLNRAGVGENGFALCDGAEPNGDMSFDMKQAALEAGGIKQMMNSVAAGAVFALLGYDVGTLCAILEKQFHKKGADTVKANIACARGGWNTGAARKGAVSSPMPAGKPIGAVTNGGDVIGLAAAVSGVKVVSSYPMSPSTAVFTSIAGLADRYGIVVEQAEDEIAAVNLICGAVYAGAPAMTTTSGGGFALMAEGLSLAGMLELPIMILLSQRPGPSTGLPTRTAQEDLLFAVHAGHGVFPRVVFAPGDLNQAYTLTRRALEVAHGYQTPVILMTDQFLIDTEKNVPPFSDVYRPIDRCLLENPPENYERYEITDSGISPRAIPGSGPFVVVDSDEHTTDGHLTEDLSVRLELQKKRMRKMEGLIAEAAAPDIYPSLEDEILLCWGSTYGPCREAVDILRAGGRRVCMMHFSQIWPINVAHVAPLFNGRKVISVEGNCNAQFAQLLRQTGALHDFQFIPRFDGLPFTAECILKGVRA